MPYAELGRTTLREIDLRIRAREIANYNAARVQLELHLAGLSAKALGEAEERDGDPERSKDEAAKDARHTARGEEIKAAIREALHLQFMPEHQRALYALRQRDEAPNTVTPLEGVSRLTARTLEGLIKELRFSYGSRWPALWRQLGEGGRERLQKTAGGIR